MADGELPRGSVAEAAAGILAGFRFDRSLSRRIADAALTAALPVIRRAVLRDAAKRILLLADLAGGLRCPACHGKPSVHHYVHATQESDYTCGCGCEWQGKRWAKADHSRSIEQSLKLLAAGKPLPDLPAKGNAGG